MVVRATIAALDQCRLLSSNGRRMHPNARDFQGTHRRCSRLGDTPCSSYHGTEYRPCLVASSRLTGGKGVRVWVWVLQRESRVVESQWQRSKHAIIVITEGDDTSPTAVKKSLSR